MRKLALSASAFIVFAATSAFASFGGNWTGRGQVKDISGTTLNCQTIRFQIEQSATSIRIGEGHVACESHQLKVADLLVDIKEGGELFMDGKKVGTITADSVRLNYKNDQGVKVRSRGQLKDGKLQYQEEWMDNDGNRVLLFQGLLTRKP